MSYTFGPLQRVLWPQTQPIMDLILGWLNPRMRRPTVRDSGIHVFWYLQGVTRKYRGMTILHQMISYLILSATFDVLLC